MTRELPQTLSMPGYSRIKLSYHTLTPATEAGLFLSKSLKVKPPYLGVVYILLPLAKVFTILEAYQEPFEALKDAGVVPPDGKLTAYEMDTVFPPEILGYVVD